MQQIRVAAGNESTRIQNKIQRSEWKFVIPETRSRNVHSLSLLQHLSASERAAGILHLPQVTLRANRSHLMSPRLNSLQPPQLLHTCASNHRCRKLSAPTKLMGTVPNAGPVPPSPLSVVLWPSLDTQGNKQHATSVASGAFRGK